MNSIFKYAIGLSILTVALHAESGVNYSIDPVYIHMRENSEMTIGESTEVETNTSNYVGLGFSYDYTYENSWKIKGSLVGSIADLNSTDVVDEDGEKIKNTDNIFVGSSSFAIGHEFLMNDQMIVSPLLGFNTFATGKAFKGLQKDEQGNSRAAEYVSSMAYVGTFTGFDMTVLLNSWQVVGEVTYCVANAQRTFHDIEAKNIRTEYSVNKSLAHGPSVSLAIVRQISDSWTASLGSEYRHLFIDSQNSLGKADAKLGFAYRF